MVEEFVFKAPIICNEHDLVFEKKSFNGDLYRCKKCKNLYEVTTLSHFESGMKHFQD